ncbi:MAG: urease accessory protein UreE [Dehalococcoidia bacterium]
MAAPASTRWLATSTAPAGTWDGGAERDTVTLAFDDRYRRRTVVTTDGGRWLLIDLVEAVALSDGDGLRLDDGGWVRVRAASESVADISCADRTLEARVAWHLGNRHLPVEVRPDALRMRQDPVIEAMVRGLGAEVTHLEAPFQPEGGAYAGNDHH